LDHLDFKNSDLFRISIFEFRIYLLVDRSELRTAYFSVS
jgi:hypothetical protein